MRVLHVTTHFNVGGITNYILTLSRSLKVKGVGVVVASSGGDLAGELERYAIPHRLLDIRTKFEFGPRVFRSAFRIAGIVRSEDIDVIHAHTRVSQVAGLVASRMTGVPMITTCHGYFKKRLRGLVDTWGSSVIAISDAVRDHLTGDLGVKDSRVALIYSGVDVDRFASSGSAERHSEAKRTLGIDGGPVIGTVGRLSAVKGQRYLIEAMKQILDKRPDAHAILLGNGDEEAALKEQARALGIDGSVRFFDSSSDTTGFLEAMDVFVFPSIKEGLGIALLEALAASRACVASKVGGIGNIIDDGYSGILVRPGDAHGIGDAVIRLLGDDRLRAAMGERGSRVVRERFTLDAMSDNVLKLYRKVSA